MKKTFICLTLSALIVLPAISQNVPKLGKNPLSKVIAAMTLEEKASLVVGTGMRMPGPPPSNRQQGNPPDQKQGPPSNNQQQGPPPMQQGPVIGETKVLVDGAAGTTIAIPRLGIPSMVVSDGPAGIRINPIRQNDNATYYCTAFPVGTLLASTWDRDLVSKVGQSMGNEALEYGIDVILGPGMNIQRNPLCGRNFEYYSEDPYLTGNIAASMVNGIESQGVGTSIKHFAANNAETNRNSVNTIVSERALREIYLEGWRIAVTQSQPWTVMSSYNLINGTYASENPDLLTKVLHNDWNFKGFVMTDWFGGKNPVAQMEAGNDLLMPGNPDQVKAIVKSVKEGKLDVKVLDRNIERILTVMLQSPRFKGFKYSNKPDLKAHALVTRNAASEGMVLLKNSGNTLPLAQGVKNVAVFGNISYDLISGGTGSGDVNEEYTVSLVEGLGNAGYKVNEDLKSLYTQYLNLTKAGRPQSRMFFMTPPQIAELNLNEDLIKGVVGQSDAAIITIGRNSGEGRDRSKDEGDFKLNEQERQLLKMVSTAYHAKGKKVVVILNVGGVIETSSWKEIPDAILLTWQAGEEAGNSIADILSGKVNPSGKLAITFPVAYEDVPSSATFPGKELEKQSKSQGGMGFMQSVPAEVTYDDGIYVGYRYYETFNVKPSYEFGYGLSYSTFDYANVKLSSSKFNGSLTVSVDVKNTGTMPGKEVAELYLTAPKGKLDKPAQELKGFVKTKLLRPGEVQTLTFMIDSHNLASFDPSVSSWIADAGTYEVKIGSSVQNIKLTASFNLAKALTVKKESVALVPKEKVNEIKPK